MYLRRNKNAVITANQGTQDTLQKIEVLKDVSAIPRRDWQPPSEYTKPTVNNILKFWYSSYRKATGKFPECPAQAMRYKAERLMLKLGYTTVLRVLEFMSTPSSKYYQYPYTLNVVEQAYTELQQIENSSEDKTYDGFIGNLKFKKMKGSDR